MGAPTSGPSAPAGATAAPVEAIAPALVVAPEPVVRKACVPGGWRVEPDYRVAGKALRHESEHFALFWAGDDVSREDAIAAVATLEDLWGHYMGRIGWPEPFCGDTIKYKVSVFLDPAWYLTGSGVGDRNMAMWIGTANARDRGGLAHEFAHALQFHSGGLRETEFGGWFWESHANLMFQLSNPDDFDCGGELVAAPHIHYGSTRLRYCGWQFFEFVKNVRGYGAVNDIWSKARPFNTDTATGEDPLEVLMRNLGLDATTLGDLFGHWATRTLTWDYTTPEGVRRSEDYARGWGVPTSPVDYGEPLTAHRAVRLVRDPDGSGWSVPDYWAPQRYGYNVVRLVPDPGASSVTVDFSGKVQLAAANRPDGSFANERSEIVAPQSGWRWSVVSIDRDGRPRYGPLQRSPQGRMTFDVLAGDRAHWLVVIATPQALHRIRWDQAYYTLYRYPWSVSLRGAVPDGHQPGAPDPTACGARHPNGGGWVECGAVVAATAFVGPDAVVLGASRILGEARIEDHAVVKGSTVRDRARIGALTFLLDSRVTGDARVATVLTSRPVAGKVVGGTAQLLGDVELGVASVSKGVYYGEVLPEHLKDPKHGSQRTAPAPEVTCVFERDPATRTWACLARP